MLQAKCYLFIINIDSLHGWCFSIFEENTKVQFVNYGQYLKVPVKILGVEEQYIIKVTDNCIHFTLLESAGLCNFWFYMY